MGLEFVLGGIIAVGMLVYLGYCLFRAEGL
ncbi:MAG: potassium-transporting ATPase subunit F [Firmicutes bacterium]|nr:potassium-transporting ATPase subunit F [Bacillota bacterium]